MKVVCKNTSRLITGQFGLLTIGKTYDVIYEDYDGYLLKDDTGERRTYNKERFDKLEDVRDKKLNKLGIT